MEKSIDKHQRKMFMVHDFLDGTPLVDKISIYWALLEESHNVALEQNPELKDDLLNSARASCKVLIRDVFGEDL